MVKQANLVKTLEEVNKLRMASHLSSNLHLLGMMKKLEGKSERDLSDYFNALRLPIGKGGDWAYPVIVGPGDRATILHAKPAKKVFENGELVLVDMGLKYKGYCSDITRTWPVGLKFTKAQKTIYSIVLKAQKEIIKRARPGGTLDSLHSLGKEHLLEGLLSKEILQTKDLNNLFPHKTSHWIGRDVHDQCPHQYADGSAVRLAPGMCFTVEPGLYFKNTKSAYEGIGVRIEDVVLITENGCEVLSNAPKEITEIEALRSLQL